MSARLFPLLDIASQSAFGSMPWRDVAPRGEPRHGGEGGLFVKVQELCVGPADKPRPVSRLEHGQKRIVRIPEGTMRFLPTEVQALWRVLAALEILREGTLGIEEGRQDPTERGGRISPAVGFDVGPGRLHGAVPGFDVDSPCSS